MKIISCATDGALSMVRKQKGFVTYLKDLNPNILTVHCIIPRQHLIAKNIKGELDISMQLVIILINKINLSFFE